MKTRLLENMTWPEVQEAIEAGNKTVIIAAASVEQHGPHLAEITDTAVGLISALDLAERLGNALVAPVIRPGLSEHHMALPGSLTLRPETFAMLVEDYVDCYVRHGFEKVVLFPAHGGNFAAIEKLTVQLSERFDGIRIVSGMPFDGMTNLFLEVEAAEGMPQGVCGGHACDFETSVVLRYYPEHVRMDKAVPGTVGHLSDEMAARLFAEGIVAASPIGVLGDPSSADAQRGERYFKMMQDKLYAAVAEKLQR